MRKCPNCECQIPELTPQERYMREPEFNALVNMLRNLLDKGQFAPSELKEAVTLAHVKFEQNRPPYGEVLR